MPTQEFQENVEKLRSNISSVIRGKSQIVELCIVALLARGHVLLEDVPGVGKTTLASVLAQSIRGTFQRMQFTSDMLPSDILGVVIYDQDRHEFEFKKGPLFANVVLADEINRTTPKTQSALLEAMNVAQVSMDGRVYELPQPFIVLATQNPVEFHGTFPLPKSQMDRFLVRLHMGYPDREHEVQVLREQQVGAHTTDVDQVLDAAQIAVMQQSVSEVKVSDDLLDYIVRIAEATRRSELIELGCSTRGAIAHRRCAQSLAAVNGRDFVTPDDIKQVAVPVLAHRIQVARTFDLGGFSYHEDEQVITRILEDVAVPL
ncbi:MAG: MoxR family ATPase [Candidatus Sumerlaeia bacterium]|nr:MoxR family ATPase [Candidatus Sumerlaeia bacterium]